VLEALVNSLKQPVNFLVNNACISRKGLLSGCTYEDFEYVQRVGVTAPYYLTNLLLQKNLLASNAAIIISPQHGRFNRTPTPKRTLPRKAELSR
jgi:short-subunit dehydrogenase